MNQSLFWKETNITITSLHTGFLYTLNFCFSPAFSQRKTSFLLRKQLDRTHCSSPLCQAFDQHLRFLLSEVMVSRVCSDRTKPASTCTRQFFRLFSKLFFTTVFGPNPTFFLNLDIPSGKFPWGQIPLHLLKLSVLCVSIYFHNPISVVHFQRTCELLKCSTYLHNNNKLSNFLQNVVEYTVSTYFRLM